jgi:hypothetical protein
MSSLETLLVTLFGLWFSLSILAQFHLEKFDRYRTHDLFHLIPNWTFFAPNPGRTDYHLIFRDKRRDGSTGDWKELPLLYRRRFWSFLWNPEKRETKVLTDAVASIFEMIEFQQKRERSKELTEQLLLIHSPYLLLLNLVMSSREPHSVDVTHRQFALVESFGFLSADPPRPILSSPFHAFDD